MLNIRAQHLIRLLQETDQTGNELATALDTSRRTVIRDINTINSVFSEHKIGQIASGKNYHLEITGEAAFQQLLNGFRREQDVVLFELLRRPTITLPELGELTYLSRAALLSMFDKLNQEFRGVLTITTKSGEGIVLTIYKTSRIDILAYLLREHKTFYAESPYAQTLLIKSALPAVQSVVPQRLFDYLTQGQLIAQITACAIGTQFAAEFESTVQLDLSMYRQIPTPLRQILENYYSVKVELLNTITVNEVREQVLALNNRQILAQHERAFITEIFSHLCRCAMFPTFADAALLKQITKLEINNPFVFDVAFALTEKLSQRFPSVDIEPQFIALYTLHTVDAPKKQNVSALLIFSQQAVGRINQMIITEQIPNIDIDEVSMADIGMEPLAIESSDLILVNGRGEELPASIPRIDMVFSGIIGDQEISKLKKITDNSFFEQKFPAFFPPTHFLSFTATGDAANILATGLKQLEANGQISAIAVNDLLAREQMSNRLVINGVSIPHATADITEAYEIFVIKPQVKHTLKIDQQPIALFLCILVKNDIVDPGKIFTYIYKHLVGINPTQWAAIDGYGSMLRMFC
ncbi:HTH domain-containing protein [Loigolactobacillus binensis]|uniref:HTH domain-containing protein n=1 Tax=Loigolactobacillus binensis TaxID=2559922 RepID=A0ABW3EBT8_9LACO|nr:HTH domain-containing protein [Loigolactobacillus binensis]